MCPEIALCLDFDTSADLFSFGMVLCELITGREPSESFLNRRPQDLFALNEQEVSDAILDGCPEALEALAMECCQVDAKKRPTAQSEKGLAWHHPPCHTQA